MNVGIENHVIMLFVGDVFFFFSFVVETITELNIANPEELAKRRAILLHGHDGELGCRILHLESMSFSRPLCNQFSKILGENITSN